VPAQEPDAWQGEGPSPARDEWGDYSHDYYGDQGYNTYGDWGAPYDDSYWGAPAYDTSGSEGSGPEWGAGAQGKAAAEPQLHQVRETPPPRPRMCAR
jgi:hypothetical protein